MSATASFLPHVAAANRVQNAARGEAVDNVSISLATARPTSRQRRLTLAAIAVVVVAYGAVAPFATIPLPKIDGFVPVVQGMVVVAELVTAVFLFSQFSITGSRSVWVLASGYLFSALIVVPHLLTFPGAFGTANFLGAGLQSAGWLYISWRFGFPAAVICYVLLKDGNHAEDTTQHSRLSEIRGSVIIVTILVCAVTWLVIAGNDYLPRLMLNETKFSSLARYASGIDLSISVVALSLLWTRRDSVLDEWLMVAVCALVAELALTVFVLEARFNLGFYTERLFEVVSSTVLLGAMVGELTRLYDRLLQALRGAQTERDRRLLSLQAVGLAISHELNQPLAALSLESNAALEFMKQSPPDLDELRTSLKNINDDALRSGQVLKNIRDLFSYKNPETQAVDLNEIILDALNLMREELKLHHVISQTELTPDLMRIIANRGQILQVILNLLRNAVEALDRVTDRNRMVRVATEHHEGGKVTITVEDTGRGIDAEFVDRIFDPFITSKPTGTGLGLALCRMIVQRHGGSIVASSEKGRGARFQIVLPTRGSK